MASLRFQRFPRRFCFLEKRPDTAEDFPCAVAVADNPLDGLAGLLECDRLLLHASQPAQTRVAVEQDAGDRLVNFMGNRRGEFTHRRHPCHMGQFGLRPSQSGFGLPRDRDIHNSSH